MYAYDNSSFTWAEQDLYGSSRLGMVTPGLTIQSSAPLANANYNPSGDPITNGTEGKRIYELTNHLGNVMVTISDRKTGVDENSDAVIDYYTAEVLTAQDYYAYGMMMPGRTYSNAGAKYKYGFNGKENDNEVKGDGNQLDYGARIYDPRLGLFLSVDPYAGKFSWLSPYNYASSNPIRFIDVNGASTGDPPTKYVYDALKVDLSKMPKSHTLANGTVRSTVTRSNGIRDNAAWYWDEVRKNNPSIKWSKGNKYRLDNGIAPTADPEFIEQFGAFKDFKNQTLEMHHMNQKNGMGIALPEELHRGSGYTKLWHKAGVAGALFGAMLTLYQQTYGQDPLLVGEFVNEMWSENELMRVNAGISQEDYTMVSRFAAGNNSRQVQ